jgi:hypothetical protein
VGSWFIGPTLARWDQQHDHDDIYHQKRGSTCDNRFETHVKVFFLVLMSRKVHVNLAFFAQLF